MKKQRQHRTEREDAARDLDFGTPHLNGHGQALEGETRAALEPKFGHSFGDVRVFADG